MLPAARRLARPVQQPVPRDAGDVRDPARRRRDDHVRTDRRRDHPPVHAAAGEGAAAVQENVTLGDKLGLTGTPAFIIGEEIIKVIWGPLQIALPLPEGTWRDADDGQPVHHSGVQRQVLADPDSGRGRLDRPKLAAALAAEMARWKVVIDAGEKPVCDWAGSVSSQ